MAPQPDSRNDSGDSPTLLGALTGTDPRAADAVRANNQRAATDPTSPLTVPEKAQQAQTQDGSGPRAKVSDYPAAHPDGPGFVPAAPDPAHTLHGYNPDDGTQFNVQLPAQAPNRGMLNDPRPAAKARLDDGPDGLPRYAVLNSAGQYLYTIDSQGQKVTSQPGGETSGLAGAGAGTILGAAATQAGSEAEVGLSAAELAALAAEGGEIGAGAGALAGGVGAVPGAAIGATVTLLVGLGLTAGLGYQLSHNDRKTGPSTGERIDPHSLPDVPQAPAPVRPYVGPQAFDPGPVAPSDPAQADDVGTGNQRVLFPSAKPGQKGVPVPGTYWEGGYLKWGEGNPEGKRPNTYAGNPYSGDGKISLKAELFELLRWNLRDIDEQYRPPVLAALAVVNGTELYRRTFYAGIEIVANGLGADTAQLTSSDTTKRNAELQALQNRGLPTAPLEDAINAWWKAKAPEDRARELLGEAGAIAMLKSDGWTVNVRPRGSYSHDLVAVKDGQVMVVEAKGGEPGRVKLGKAGVEGGAYGATQMTDPYLWAKLKEDAENDPSFRDWLEKRSVWDAVDNEDPSRVGYRLIRTDTDGNIIVYGSTQEPVNGGILRDTVTGKTTGNKPITPPTGNKPGLPPDNPNPGPTLHGVALPLTGGPLYQLLAPANVWLEAPASLQLDDLTTVAPLAVPVQPIFALQPGLWPRRKLADQSLTVNIAIRRSSNRVVTKAEQRRCMSYGAHL